jgi:DNA-binding transcriptional LysR family regulator
VATTAFGREIEPMARRLIDEFENQLLSISGVGDRQAGQVTIACVPTAAFYFLPKAIKEFNNHYPRIGFRLLDPPQEDHPLLMTVPFVDPVVTRTIGIVERRVGRLSPAAQRFRDMLAGSWTI